MHYSITSGFWKVFFNDFERQTQTQLEKTCNLTSNEYFKEMIKHMNQYSS